MKDIKEKVVFSEMETEDKGEMKGIGELIAQYSFFASAIMLSLLGLMSQLAMGTKPPETVVMEFLMPAAIVSMIYLTNRQLHFVEAVLDRGLKLSKLLAACIPCMLIAVSLLLADDADYLRDRFPALAIMCMAAIPCVFRDDKVGYPHLGIIGSALAFSWTGLSLGSGVAAVLSIYAAALMLIIATTIADGFFADEGSAVKTVVAEICLTAAFMIMVHTPEGILAVLQDLSAFLDDELRRSTYFLVMGAGFGRGECISAAAEAANVLPFILERYGDFPIRAGIASVISFVIFGGIIAFENESHALFFAVAAWIFMSIWMVAYFLFLFGWDLMFPFCCPLLDPKSVPMSELYWLMVFCILRPHDLSVRRRRRHQCRLQLDLDEYIVSNMDRDELLLALQSEEYRDRAWRRLTGGADLSEKDEIEIVESLPQGRPGAVLLRDYIRSRHISRGLWEHTLIYFCEYLTEDEYADLLYSFRKIYGGAGDEAGTRDKG